MKYAEHKVIHKKNDKAKAVRAKATRCVDDWSRRRLVPYPDDWYSS